MMITKGMHYQTTPKIINVEDATLDLDYDFIQDTTDDLSEIGRYNAKGRAFGTQGELDAWTQIKALMQDNITGCGLENVYDQPIDNVWYPYQYVRYKGEELASKLSTDYQYIKFNNTNNPDETFSLENTFTNPETDNWEFCIRPSFNKVYKKLIKNPRNFDYSKLSGNISGSDLQIVYKPKCVPGNQIYINNFINSRYEAILNRYNNMIDDPFSSTSIEEIIINELEDYFNFHIDDLDPNNTSNWPPFFEIPQGVTGDYVLICEDQNFNPHPQPKLWWENLPFKNSIKNILRYIATIPNEKKLRACIYFDFHENLFDMNLNPLNPVPIIYINGSNTNGGNKINKSRDDYTMDFQLTQSWDEEVDSYNVIGEIPGLDNTKTVIVSSLYDCWWNQGTADSATGMSIVLGIAKYLKQIGITPKYKIKFIAFSGEEYGLRGAKYYNALHDGQTLGQNRETKENITYMLDLNQLGFNQPSEFNGEENELDFIIQCNKINIHPIYNKLDKIIKRLNMSFLKPEVNSSWSTNVLLGNQIPFAMSRQIKLQTLFFVKDTKWRNHHRSGDHHNSGDNMTYYNESEVENATRMIWDILKYIAINPNCWIIDNSVEYTLSDTNNDGCNDKASVNLSIKSIMEYDRVLLTAQLIYKDGPIRKLLYSNLTKQNLIIGKNKVDVTINVSMAKSMPKGNYILKISLYNSTGEIDRWDRPIFDITGFNDKFVNDTYETTVYLSPPNKCPIISSNLSIASYRSLGGKYEVTADDPDNDTITYQMRFKDPSGKVTYTDWSKPQTSGASYKVSHSWDKMGIAEVYVKARDTLMLDDCGEWSDVLYVNLSPAATINATPNPALPDETVTYNAYSLGYSEDPDYNVSYGDDSEPEPLLKESGVGAGTHEYDHVGEMNVTLKVKDGEFVLASESCIVNVVDLRASFNPSEYAVKKFQDNNFTGFADSNTGYTPTNYTWDFGDGNISYGLYASHNYSKDGKYNVTLTIKGENETENTSNSCTKTIYVDSVEPMIVYVDQVKGPLGLGMNDVKILVYVYDKDCGVESVYLNFTYPDGSYLNDSMTANETYYYAYEYHFSDTWEPGQYNYTVWVKDKAGNLYGNPGFDFFISNIFGGIIECAEFSTFQNVEDRETGTAYYCYESGYATGVTAMLNTSGPCNARCRIYWLENMTLLASTEENIVNVSGTPEYVTFSFSDPKPYITNDTWYVITCNSDDVCNLVFYNLTQEIGRYRNQTYESNFSEEWNNDSHYNVLYCNYSTYPSINLVEQSTGTLGIGFPVNISANISDESHDVSLVNLIIGTPDDDNDTVLPMIKIDKELFYYNFSDTWYPGQYNYTISACDRMGCISNSIQYCFNVSVNTSIGVCTIKNNYVNNETVNLTDPPGYNPQMIGYELLDNNSVLHLWNRFDDYYFNTSSGVQMTNHYDEYWSRNVLMLGYYANDNWNVIYRTDELSGFHHGIDTDNQTFVNITLWKNLTYQGYNFRLAIRYHLGLDDNDLTIIPYIKNLGNAIPYILGFAWEINDIQINMTSENDFIEINCTSYPLNQTLDEMYTDMKTPVYCYNETLNESIICDYEPVPYFYISEELSDNWFRTLYLKWDSNLDYKVWVKSRIGEYNAPVILGVKIGTLSVNQSKQTVFHWYDSDQKKYIFNGYDNNEAWSTNPGYMVNGNIYLFSTTTVNADVELCNNDNCSGVNFGPISKVEIRAYGYRNGGGSLKLRPVFSGGDGDDHVFSLSMWAQWSTWYDITNDTNAPSSWTWNDVKNLDCDVESVIDGLPWYTVACSQVEIRVTYSQPVAPTITYVYPSNGTDNIVISPTLAVTVSGENPMNITWWSNSSGSWEVFGRNDSVSAGTYLQVFSNATVNGEWWYWKVNVSNPWNYSDSGILLFYTGRESKISNTGETDIRGFLCGAIEYFNESSEEWEWDKDLMIIEQVINGSEELALDKVFNGLVNTSCLNHGDGLYRFYVALKDPYNNVLIGEIGEGGKQGSPEYLESWWSFWVTYD